MFDTMREWAGYRGYVKQSDLQEVFQIEPNPELELVDGSMVADFWRDAHFHDIAEYNRDDVRVCREIYRRMTWA